MKHLNSLLIVGCLTGILTTESYADLMPPSRLTTDLLEHTGSVMQDGYLSSMGIEDTAKAIERYQLPLIRTTRPTFGWVMNSDDNDTRQTAYRILVASSKDKLREGESDIWDSGNVRDSNSSSVYYGGKPLDPDHLYFWTVKVWDNHGQESGYATPKGFMTAPRPDGNVSTYPLEAMIDLPKTTGTTDTGIKIYDFGKTRFGTLMITAVSENEGDTLTLRIGERMEEGRVFFKPEGSKSSIRSAEYSIALRPGTHTYTLKIMPDARNTETSGRNESGVPAILMPDYAGEVFPFRWCEVEARAGSPEVTDMIRRSIRYPFNCKGAEFFSSDTTLNRVWDLCRHSIEATTFCGIYVDGDRERIPYEADAIIGQLGHYATDREFSMARASLQHLIENPTWPTEWNLQIPIIAWNDYMHTGDSRMLKKNYETIKAKTLMALRGENGLISLSNNTDPEALYKSINFKGKRLKDIIDWPQSGFVGEEKERPGEADGYEKKTCNTVVNAYHYNTLVLMKKIAQAIGKDDEAEFFAKEAEEFKKNFNRLLFNDSTGHYRDGIGTDHESLHGNMMPLVFGLVPERHRGSVTDYVKQRRMACSVFGAQFLLDALYGQQEGDYAMKLLTSEGERSWYNMLRAGSTITMEAWDDKYKPNQDWNHAWGAAPANLIPRGVFGIMPLEPGFSRFSIKPQPGGLEYAKLRLPSIKGDIMAEFHNHPEKSFEMNVEIPANTAAEVSVPAMGRKNILTIDGKKTSHKVNEGFISFMLTSGHHSVSVSNSK